MAENMEWAFLKIVSDIFWIDDKTKNNIHLKTYLVYPNNYISIINDLFINVYTFKHFFEI